MKLIPDWKLVLTKAFSAWIFYALILVSTIETALSAAGDSLSRSMPVGAYPLLVAVTSALGLYLRVRVQKAFEKQEEKA